MIQCPNCSSREVAREHRTFWDRIVSLVLGLYPFSCDRCGHQFKARYHPPPRPIDS